MNHETVSGWCVRKGCRRPECLERRRRYVNRTRKLQRLGRSRTVSALPSRARVRSWLRQGYSYRQMAVASGVEPNNLRKIADPGRAWVRATTALAILSAELHGPPMGEVPATGTVRRVRSLVRDGHSREELAPAIAVAAGVQVSDKWLTDVLNERLRTTSAAKARAVETLFDALALHPGRSSRAREYGRRQGWCRPLAWDDEVLDDPDAKAPEDVDTWRCPCGRELVSNWRYSRMSAVETVRRDVWPHMAKGLCPRCHQASKRERVPA